MVEERREPRRRRRRAVGRRGGGVCGWEGPTPPTGLARLSLHGVRAACDLQ